MGRGSGCFQSKSAKAAGQQPEQSRASAQQKPGAGGGGGDPAPSTTVPPPAAATPAAATPVAATPPSTTAATSTAAPTAATVGVTPPVADPVATDPAAAAATAQGAAPLPQPTPPAAAAVAAASDERASVPAASAPPAAASSAAAATATAAASNAVEEAAGGAAEQATRAGDQVSGSGKDVGGGANGGTAPTGAVEAAGAAPAAEAAAAPAPVIDSSLAVVKVPAEVISEAAEPAASAGPAAAAAAVAAAVASAAADDAAAVPTPPSTEQREEAGSKLAVGATSSPHTDELVVAAADESPVTLQHVTDVGAAPDVMHGSTMTSALEVAEESLTKEEKGDKAEDGAPGVSMAGSSESRETSTSEQVKGGGFGGGGETNGAVGIAAAVPGGALEEHVDGETAGGAASAAGDASDAGSSNVQLSVEAAPTLSVEGAESRLDTAEGDEGSVVRVFIVYYSMYGHVATLAQKVKEGVDSVEGAEGVLYQVPETLSESVLAKMGAPPRSTDVPVLTSAKALVDADGFVFGIPTRFGAMCAQIKAFLDETGQLWQRQALAGKPAGLFFSTGTQGGGQETTAWTAVSQLAHHGMLYVPVGYTFAGLFSPEVHGGSPWGAGTYAGDGTRVPSELELEMAVHQGRITAIVASKLKYGGGLG